jgi:hypothetical protein
MASSPEPSGTATSDPPVPDTLASNVVDLTIEDLPEFSEDGDTNPEGAIASNETPATAGNELESSNDGTAGPEAAIASNEDPAVVSSKKKDKRKGRRGPSKGKGVNTSDIPNGAPVPDPTPESSAAPEALIELTEEQAAEFGIVPQQQDPASSSDSQKNIGVPVVPHYELRSIPTGAENITSDTVYIPTGQHGLFATKDIPAGTRIICENPLFSLSIPVTDPRLLFLEYINLTSAEQARYWLLNPAPIAATRELMSMANAIDSVYLHITRLRTKSARTKQDISELTKWGKKVDDAISTLRLAARFHTASFRTSDTDKETPYMETGNMRHSCVPNCFNYINSETNRMMVHTLRDIKAGEELTITLVLQEAYFMTEVMRKKELKEKACIECRCPACDESSSIFTSQEDLRSSANASIVSLGQIINDLPDYFDPLSDSLITRETLKKAEELANSILADLGDLQAFNSPEIIKVMAVLVGKINPRLAEYMDGREKVERWDLIRMQATHALEAAKICCGVDSEAYKVGVERKERVEEMMREVAERAERLEESKKKLEL